jgi:hypothetical protein
MASVRIILFALLICAAITLSTPTRPVAASPTPSQLCYPNPYQPQSSYNWYYWYPYGYYPYNYNLYGYASDYCGSYYGNYYSTYCGSYHNYYPNYCGSNYNYAYPYTPQLKYQLQVSTNPRNVAAVKGSGYYSQGTLAEFTITRNTVQVSPLERYVFSHWTGDYSGVGLGGSITMDSAKNVTAVYQHQYWLHVNVQPSQSAPKPSGTGWYDAGDTVTLSVPTSASTETDTSRQVFRGWSVDDGTTQNTMTIDLTMSSPHNVTAQYKTQYYLNVESDHGVTYGSGWYDAGSAATIYVTTPTSPSYGVSLLFNGWRGDTNSLNQTSTVNMNEPRMVIATWTTDKTVLNLTIMLTIVAATLVGVGLLAYTKARLGSSDLKVQKRLEEHRLKTGPDTPS